MESSILHIALIEDEEEIRQALRLIINGSKGFHCPCAFPDAERALEELANYTVDVILMDIDLPGQSGIEATRILKKRLPQVDIVMLTVKFDDDSIFESLCAGATGYLLKDTDPAELLQSVREVSRGGSPMSSRIARRIVNSFRIIDHSLTNRETEILKHLSSGKNYKQVADLLFISPNTVKTHIKNIYGKLHVNTRAEAVYKAIKQRLI